MKNVMKKLKSAIHSEYMPWYFLNNNKYFKINIVDLPKKLIRNHRLTLDYKRIYYYLTK